MSGVYNPTGFVYDGEYIKYYNRLHTTKDKKGLLPENEGKMIVCEEYLASFDGEQKVCHRFFAMRSIVELVVLISKLAEEGTKTHLYEVIRGDRPQKPFFDVDMDSGDLNGLDPYLIVEDLIDAIQKCGVDKRYILVCETSCPNKTKYSFHIIVQRSVNSSRHAKAFAESVVGKMDEVHAAFVDLDVYNQNRQMRLVESCKLRLDGKAPRIKKISKKYTTYRLFGNRFDTLATIISLDENHYCEYLDVYVEEVQRKTFSGSAVVSVEQIKEVVALIPDFAEFEREDGQMILLRRIAPSHCDVCDRVHHAQNLYIYITREGNIELSCRRSSERKRTLLGRLSTPLLIENHVEEEFFDFEDEDFLDLSPPEVEELEEPSPEKQEEEDFLDEMSFMVQRSYRRP